ncbi:hypothetical protein H6802_02760 [Candidatus Nomurabacteria bacterium]|nr:hypothetical protein [Candidatus Nomurabacteria bacterium]MCB9827795.1 hypothetical protein [Candidatus Nomurabacteria bacterium]HXK52622.1 hypothetical protein [bacterium]
MTTISSISGISGDQVAGFERASMLDKQRPKIKVTNITGAGGGALATVVVGHDEIGGESSVIRFSVSSTDRNTAPAEIQATLLETSRVAKNELKNIFSRHSLGNSDLTNLLLGANIMEREVFVVSELVTGGQSVGTETITAYLPGGNTVRVSLHAQGISGIDFLGSNCWQLAYSESPSGGLTIDRGTWQIKRDVGSGNCIIAHTTSRPEVHAGAAISTQRPVAKPRNVVEAEKIAANERASLTLSSALYLVSQAIMAAKLSADQEDEDHFSLPGRATAY